jgi:deazaflavin-dependent oxidoreductase (nitroreductase family)
MLTPVRKFNKHILNRVIRTFAGKSRTPFVIVRHKGRRSGKSYETPIIAIRRDAHFLIELTYGPNVDWYRNVQAAGGCEILWHNQTFTIDQIEPLDAEEGLAAFPQPFRFILHLLGRRDFAQLRIEAANTVAKL